MIRMIRGVLSRTVRRSERWWARHQSMTIRSGEGAGLKFNTRNASANYIEGTNEIPVQKAMARYLNSGDVFYDIGANVGFFSLIAARMVGSSGKVYAFEPVPTNAAVVRRNARLNNLQNITVYEKAVSSSPGKGELLLAEHPGGAMLATAGATMNSASRGAITVDLVSIDEMIAQKALTPPSLVKVDVEGVELDVLRGMSESIKQFKPIVIYETDDKYQEAFMRKNKEVDEFLEALGYEITTLEAAYAGTKWNVRHAVATPTSGSAQPD